MRETPTPRRALFVDEQGGGLRATWHARESEVVLSVWRDDVCVGTHRLSPADAARLADFLQNAPDAHRTGHLQTWPSARAAVS